MRFLAIDLGDKRTGLAVGDDELHMAHPVGVLEIPIGQRLVDAIAEAIQEHAADEVVMGLPLHMDGTPGKRVEITVEFGDRVAKTANVKIHYQDERLTSASAEERLSGSGKTHKQKKQARDALAATEILKDFLGSNRSSL
jgi:putative Holliday junction resolvase